MASISGGGKIVNVIKVLKEALRSRNNAIIYNIYEKSRLHSSYTALHQTAITSAPYVRC
jgi:hypothetical protein